jgi:enoyl-CoA hydratase/carnithine racemase
MVASHGFPCMSHLRHIRALFGARAFLTLAEGGHFCGGADVVSNFVGKNSNFGRRTLAKAFAITQKVERLPIPTVVAVRGLCLGGGCELMQLHDIAFVGEDAGIGQVEAQIATSTLLGGASRLVFEDRRRPGEGDGVLRRHL